MEPEAGAGCASGSERTEETRAQIVSHPRAVVFDDHFHRSRERRGGYADAAALAGHRLERVAQEVDQDLLQRDLIEADSRDLRREIALQYGALARGIALEKRPGRLDRLVDVTASSSQRRSLLPGPLDQEVDALHLLDDGRRAGPHGGIVAVRFEQELRAGPDARQRLPQLVRQLGQRQRGIVLLGLAHPVSSATDIEPPRFVSCKQRVSLDLAADRPLHELRRSHASAHRDAAAADRNIGYSAEARTGPYTDEPLSAARLARRRAPGEDGDRARFQRDAQSTCEGQARTREGRRREREEVPRDRLLRAADHGGDFVPPGERVGSQQQGALAGTQLPPHADAGTESWRSKRTAVRHAAALSPGEEEPRFARRLERDRGAGQLPVSGSHPGLRSASIRGGLQIRLGDAGCR